jgi:two-component system cell cycle response regulator DivK
MAGESILIIDDSPLNLKLARILLESQGYVIGTAKEGNEALSMVSTFKPRLILMDVQMPGIDGLEVTRRIKANPNTRDIIVVALTSYAMKGDREKARSAGCDGYITKPFDSQKLLLQIRQYLDTANGAPVEEVHPLGAAESQSLLEDLAREFVAEGEKQSRRLRDEVKTGLDVKAAKGLAHRWAGTGGTLGFPEISQAAFEIENLLENSPSNVELLETRFRELVKLFANSLKSSQHVVSVPAGIAEVLSGRRVELISFEKKEASRMQQFLQAAGASCHFIDAYGIDRSASGPVDIDIVNVPGSHSASGVQFGMLPATETPVLLIGPPDLLLQTQLDAQNCLHDFLSEPYAPEEILVRCCQLISRSRNRKGKVPGGREEGPARVLIADDDPTVTALVRTTIQGHGMECLAAAHAGDVVRMAAEFKPDVIVLDVNMPQMDGFEVLASIKNDDRTKEIAVVMLTARQQESDIMKGFGLGAADYIVKPFSPMELVARIRRLVRK